MEYKTTGIYQRISSIHNGIKDNLKKTGALGKTTLLEAQKVLVGHGSYSNEPVGAEFDFVVFNKPHFKWSEQKNKNDVLLVAKVIYKTSIDTLKKDITQELLNLHSIQAVRKVIIVVNTKDELNLNQCIVPYFMNHYDFLLKFPQHFSNDLKDSCPMCGSSCSHIEAWFYNEESEELLPIEEYMNDDTYFQ